MPLNEKSKSVLKKLAVAAGISVTSLISYEVFYWFTHVYEYDARIEAELTTLSSRIDGEIEKGLVPQSSFAIEMKADCPDLFLREWTLRSDILAGVPSRTMPRCCIEM